mmetsp:Transcript_27568/g.49669  ORF Transcript_27568/g.49669 Transcript_27568/m.49669 type:complete len:275 (-) Transcript_27568:594-1418(-)
MSPPHVTFTDPIVPWPSKSATNAANCCSHCGPQGSRRLSIHRRISVPTAAGSSFSISWHMPGYVRSALSQERSLGNKSMVPDMGVIVSFIPWKMANGNVHRSVTSQVWRRSARRMSCRIVPILMAPESTRGSSRYALTTSGRLQIFEASSLAMGAFGGSTSSKVFRSRRCTRCRASSTNDAVKRHSRSSGRAVSREYRNAGSTRDPRVSTTCSQSFLPTVNMGALSTTPFQRWGDKVAAASVMAPPMECPSRKMGASAAFGSKCSSRMCSTNCR